MYQTEKVKFDIVGQMTDVNLFTSKIIKLINLVRLKFFNSSWTLKYLSNLFFINASFSFFNIPQVKKHKSLTTSGSSCHVVVDSQELCDFINHQSEAITTGGRLHVFNNHRECDHWSFNVTMWNMEEGDRQSKYREHYTSSPWDSQEGMDKSRILDWYCPTNDWCKLFYI